MKNEMKIEIHTNEGQQFASVSIGEFGCDFYASGEEIDWQDNNGLLANCDPATIKAARVAACLIADIGEDEGAALKSDFENSQGWKALIDNNLVNCWSDDTGTEFVEMGAQQ